MTWLRKHPLISFFFLAYLIAYGSAFILMHMQPESPRSNWSIGWLLYVLSPTISAVIIAWIVGGSGEVRRLLSGFTRWKVGWFWYFAAAFPFVGSLAFGLIHWLLVKPVAELAPGETAFAVLGQVVFTLLSGPLSEEAGWRGFALPRLQSKFNPLVSSLILGVFWCCWHIPLFLMPGSLQHGIPFAVYLVLVVTLAVYFTWLYNNTGGSLIITVLAHFFFNLSGSLIGGTLKLLPPVVVYAVAGCLLVLAVFVIIVSGGVKNLPEKTAEEPAG